MALLVYFMVFCFIKPKDETSSRIPTSQKKVVYMRSFHVVSTLFGAALVAATIYVAVPASALDPLTYTVNCSIVGTDVKEDVPIYAGQDAVFTFSPATCTQAYWSYMNPALSDDLALSGTGSVTIAAADVICDSEFEFVMADSSTYYYLTFTGCGTAPAPADPLPDTGINATALGLAATGLLAAGVVTMVIKRRRSA